MISLHFVVDFAEDAHLERGLQYLIRTKQTSVNIAGGAQLDRTMQFTERVRKALPNATIHFRLLEDTGIILKLTPEQWFSRYVAPRIQWLRENKIVLVVDNETSGDDSVIRTYVERQTRVAEMLHAINLNGSFCRFSTGQLNESQYQLLKPLLDTLKTGDFVSPNEYSNVHPRSSGGHLERYKRIEKVAGRTLPISIGEAGILVDYKPDAGYQGINMAGKDMAAQLLAEEIWYRGGTIPRHGFLIGGNQKWRSLRFGDDALEFLEGFYESNPIPQPTTPPVVITPPAPQPAPKPQPIPQPPPPEPAPLQTIMVPLKVLQDVRRVLQVNVDMVGRLGVQLATIREDMTAELQIVDALVQKATGKNETDTVSSVQSTVPVNGSSSA